MLTVFSNLGVTITSILYVKDISKKITHLEIIKFGSMMDYANLYTIRLNF